jgi:hypothetical protein
MFILPYVGRDVATALSPSIEYQQILVSVNTIPKPGKREDVDSFVSHTIQH